MSDLGVDPEEDGDGAPPPEQLLPEEMSGEYRDGVNYPLLSAGVVIGGFFYWIDWQLFASTHPPVGLVIFTLIFPTLCQIATFRALCVVTLGFDRSGWHYRRTIFGRTLESEEGRWSDIAQTGFRQWATRGRYGATLYGELTMWDAGGKAVLRARTCFQLPAGNPGADHAPGRRQIGLSPDDFWAFVRMINYETPQVPYGWMRDLDNARPARNRFLYADPGPARYVRAPKGPRAPEPNPLPTPF